MKKLFFAFLFILQMPVLLRAQITLNDTLEASFDDEFGDGSIVVRASISKASLGLRTDNQIYQDVDFHNLGVYFELYRDGEIFDHQQIIETDQSGDNYNYTFLIDPEYTQGDLFIKAVYAYRYCPTGDCDKYFHVDQSVAFNNEMKTHDHYVYNKIYSAPLIRKCDGSYILRAALNKIDYIGASQNTLFCSSWNPEDCEYPFDVDGVTWGVYKDNVLQNYASLGSWEVGCTDGKACATFNGSVSIPANSPGVYQLRGRFVYTPDNQQSWAGDRYFHSDYTEPVSIYADGSGITFCPPATVLSDFTQTQGWTNMDQNPRYMADINGDGKSDIVGMGASDVYVSLSNCTSNTSSFGTTHVGIYNSFTQAQGWTNNEVNPRYLSDVTGDGKADIVGFSNNGVQVAVSNGNSFNTPSMWVYGFDQANGWSSNSLYYRVLADVNGDGKNDIVGFANNGVYVSLSTGSSFTSLSQWLSGNFCPAQGWNDNNIYPRFLVDMNNDGKKDIIGFGGSAIIVSLSTGSSFGAANTWLVGGFCVVNGFTEQFKYPRFVRDVDGDNLPDIVGSGNGALFMSKNNGTSFGAPYVLLYDEFSVSKGFINTNDNPRWLANINGDNYPDMVGVGNNCGLYISKNNGNGTFDHPQVINEFDIGSSWTTSNTFPRFLTNVDNDSRDEIVGFGASYVFVENGTCTGANAFRLVKENDKPAVKTSEESDIYISKNYPNPFQESTSIDYNLGDKYLQTQVTCSDITGRVLFNKKLDASSGTLHFTKDDLGLNNLVIISFMINGVNYKSFIIAHQE